MISRRYSAPSELRLLLKNLTLTLVLPPHASGSLDGWNCYVDSHEAKYLVEKKRILAGDAHCQKLATT